MCDPSVLFTSRDAEISNLHHLVLVHQQVRGLQVAVHHVHFVQVIHPERDAER
jgi:hypothetical protein